jgi:hypothetical protein
MANTQWAGQSPLTTIQPRDVQILDALEDSLKLATVDENWKHRVGRQTELRARFNAPDLTIRYMGHFQIINLEGHEITIGALANDDQIAAEINKLRQTGTPNMSITGAANLAGTIKDRINAAKAKVAQVSQNTDNALAKLNDAADTGDRIAKQIVAEADGLLAEIGQFSNGGPE